MDLENGRTVVKVSAKGEVFVQPTGDGLNLALQANNSQTSNLQEWRDSGGTPQAWIDASGNPGGTLAGGGGNMFRGNQDAFWSDSPFSAPANYLVSAESSGGDLEIDLPEDPDEGTVVGVQMPTDANGHVITVTTTDGTLISSFVMQDQRPAIGDSATESIQTISTTLYLQPGDDITLSLNQTTGATLTPNTTLLVTRIS
jgi:hypothetical protein